MFTFEDDKVIVFGGLSINEESVKKILPEAEYSSPLRRGQLLETFEAGFSSFLIIDGVFEQNLAASPAEILELLGRGAYVSGASSMGAMRAAELDQYGMFGIGKVYSYIKEQVGFCDDWLGQIFDLDTLSPITIPFIEAALFLKTKDVDLSSWSLNQIPQFSDLDFNGYSQWIDSTTLDDQLKQSFKSYFEKLFSTQEISVKKRDALELLQSYKKRREFLTSQ